MPLQREQLFTCACFPELASPVITSGNEHVSTLVESAVGQGLLMGLELLVNSEILVLV
jgi:hypothetical protein